MVTPLPEQSGRLDSAPGGTFPAYISLPSQLTPLEHRTEGKGGTDNTSHPPTPMSVSTPRKSTSGQITPSLPAGASTSSAPRRQNALKLVMEKEIADQTFEFPSLELARILSPKTPKHGIDAAGKLLELHQYDCDVDSQPFQDALHDVVARLEPFTPQTPGSAEEASYSTLAKFLTGCVKVCHRALDK